MEQNKKELFGSKLRHLREDKGLTEDQTAELTDMDVARLQGIENSQIIDLDLAEVLIFAKLFTDNDIAKLISGTEQEELTILCEKQGKKPSKRQMDSVKAKYTK